MVHGDGPVGLDSVSVAFDDERAVADAGITAVATLAGRLGIEALVDERVDLGDRDGAGSEGAKVMTLVSAMALGADCIDDCDVLRSGSGRSTGEPAGSATRSAKPNASSRNGACRPQQAGFVWLQMPPSCSPAPQGGLWIMSPIADGQGSAALGGEKRFRGCRTKRYGCDMESVKVSLRLDGDLLVS
jgi:hypothetical protein